jgi:hypothetical protein
MGAAGSLLPHSHSNIEGSLPLNHRLYPLHELNLAITAHHRSALSDVDLETLTTHDLHSLLRAYSAYQTTLVEDYGPVVSPRASRAELALKARQLAKYLDNLAYELDGRFSDAHAHLSSSMLAENEAMSSPQLLMEAQSAMAGKWDRHNDDNEDPLPPGEEDSPESASDIHTDASPSPHSVPVTVPAIAIANLESKSADH